jgi:hypothetical protein
MSQLLGLESMNIGSAPSYKIGFEHEKNPIMFSFFTFEYKLWSMWQEKSDGTQVKLYFIAIELSHYSYKYVEWLNRPFNY